MNSMSAEEKKALSEAAGVLGMPIRQLLEHQLQQHGASTSSSPSKAATGENVRKCYATFMFRYGGNFIKTVKGSCKS